MSPEQLKAVQRHIIENTFRGLNRRGGPRLSLADYPVDTSTDANSNTSEEDKDPVSAEVTLSNARGLTSNESRILAENYSDALEEGSEESINNFLNDLGVRDFKLKEAPKNSRGSIDKVIERVNQIVNEASIYASENETPLSKVQQDTLRDALIESANNGEKPIVTSISGARRASHRLTLSGNDTISPNERRWKRERDAEIREFERDMLLGLNPSPPVGPSGLFYRGFTDNPFVARDEEFKKKLSDLKIRVKNIRIDSPNGNPLLDYGLRERINAKDLSDKIIEVADQESYLGDQEAADGAYELALSLADFAAGITPGVSIAKDAYELFTGKNVITGEELSGLDRTLAAAGLFYTRWK